MKRYADTYNKIKLNFVYLYFFKYRAEPFPNGITFAVIHGMVART